MKRQPTDAEIKRVVARGTKQEARERAERKRKLKAGWTITLKDRTPTPGLMTPSLIVGDQPQVEVWHKPPPKPRKKRTPKSADSGDQPPINFPQAESKK
jgi:hypothetical protein